MDKESKIKKWVGVDKLAAIVGSNWNDPEPGPRTSNWNNEPSNSNNNVAARGRSDQFISVELVTATQAIILKNGQPRQPASANTLRGL